MVAGVFSFAASFSFSPRARISHARGTSRGTARALVCAQVVAMREGYGIMEMAKMTDALLQIDQVPVLYIRPPMLPIWSVSDAHGVAVVWFCSARPTAPPASAWMCS